MAYAFSAKFDVSSLKELNSKLSTVSAEAYNAVRKSNRKWAAKLRDLIRAAAPSGGGKYGARHDTPRGALKSSIRSRASADHAYVQGGGGSAPHAAVQEFGGGVLWIGGGKSHGIGVKPPRADGYFFFPTAKDNADKIVQDAIDEATKIIMTTLAR
jgi:hypothetical protein